MLDVSLGACGPGDCPPAIVEALKSLVTIRMKEVFPCLTCYCKLATLYKFTLNLFKKYILFLRFEWATEE